MSTTNDKPTTNMARDLLLLATVAYRGRKYDNAGALFAAAMSSEGAQELIEELEAISGLPHSEEELSALSSASGEDGMSLSEIISSLSAAMEAEDEEDGDLDTEEEDDGLPLPESDVDGLPLPEGVLEDDEGDSEDPDPDSPGQMILPASISSTSAEEPAEDEDTDPLENADGEDGDQDGDEEGVLKPDDRALKHRPSTDGEDSEDGDGEDEDANDEEPDEEGDTSTDIPTNAPTSTPADPTANSTPTVHDTPSPDKPGFVSVLASSPVSLL